MRQFLSALTLMLLAAAVPQASAVGVERPFYLGADLSFANEMQDCGVTFRYLGAPIDPFMLLKRKHGNLVRVRIWNNPTRTRYSNLADVERTIRRAREAGLQTLLDFHYSDDWADGDKQNPPAAWAALDSAHQAAALHDYTRGVLDTLAKADLAPDFVQVGNETNGEMLAGNKKQID